MFEIVYKAELAPGVEHIMVVAPRVARKARAGQFVILRVHEQGERIPFTIADRDAVKGTVSIIYQMVGQSTRRMSRLSVGDHILDLVGPLGHPTELDGLHRVLCIGGGVGTAVVFPIIRDLHERGAEVDVIEGARSYEYIILEKELNELATQVYITTDDGTAGHKGFVTDVLRDLLDRGEQYDAVIAIGPVIMMKFVAATTRPYGVKTIVSMNPIMIDGTGMCGGCRVTVGGETRYACVDGPEFDGHAVDFDELMRRQQLYTEQERRSDENCRLQEVE